ncbi:MAG: hypothetical protein ABI402_10825 [Ferruginibacter sp.]
MKHLPIILLASLFFLAACSSQNKNDVKANDKYEKVKLSVEEIEKKNPERFLSISGNDKKNLLGQTVIKGNIFNNAKMVQFKDVEIKLFFYSGTGTLLEEDQQTVYETIYPGGKTSFKSKYFAPKGTDSVGMKVISAKF